MRYIRAITPPFALDAFCESDVKNEKKKCLIKSLNINEILISVGSLVFTEGSELWSNDTK